MNGNIGLGANLLTAQMFLRFFGPYLIYAVSQKTGNYTLVQVVRNFAKY